MTADRAISSLLALSVYSVVAMAVLSVVADLAHAVSRGWRDWRK